MVTWPRSLPVWPPGGAKYFFSNSIFSATLCPISEIFSGSCAPRRALLKFRGTRSSGVKFGGQAPRSEFFCFFFHFSKKNWSIDFRINVLNDRYWGPLWSLKFKKNPISSFRENGVQKFWGRGTFLISPPWGAPFPHLTLSDFGPRDPDENSFCSGEIAPHLGEIWILVGLHFGPLFLEIRSSDFGCFKPIASIYGLLSIPRI